MSKLIKYELTEDAKKLLPKNEGAKAHPIEIPTTSTDPHFSCRVDLLQDYHAEMLLARKDGLGARWVKIKGGSPKPVASVPPAKTKS